MKAATPKPRTTILPAFVEHGRKLLQDRHIEEAVVVLRTGLTETPNADAALLLARALVVGGRFAEARGVLESLIETVCNVDAFYLLARVLLALRDGPAALAFTKTALRSFPKDPTLEALRIQAEGELGDEVALRALPESGRGRNWLFGDSGEQLPIDDRPSVEVHVQVASLNELTDDAATGLHDSTEVLDEPETPVRRQSGPAQSASHFGPLLGSSPSLEVAVQRFSRAADPGGRAPFGSLLGEGPPLPRATVLSTAPAADPDDTETHRESNVMSGPTIRSAPASITQALTRLGSEIRSGLSDSQPTPRSDLSHAVAASTRDLDTPPVDIDAQAPEVVGDRPMERSVSDLSLSQAVSVSRTYVSNIESAHADGGLNPGRSLEAVAPSDLPPLAGASVPSSPATYAPLPKRNPTSTAGHTLANIPRYDADGELDASEQTRRSYPTRMSDSDEQILARAFDELLSHDQRDATQTTPAPVPAASEARSRYQLAVARQNAVAANAAKVRLEVDHVDVDVDAEDEEERSFKRDEQLRHVSSAGDAAVDPAPPDDDFMGSIARQRAGRATYARDVSGIDHTPGIGADDATPESEAYPPPELRRRATRENRLPREKESTGPRRPETGPRLPDRFARQQHAGDYEAADPTSALFIEPSLSDIAPRLAVARERLPLVKVKDPASLARKVGAAIEPLADPKLPAPVPDGETMALRARRAATPDTLSPRLRIDCAVEISPSSHQLQARPHHDSAVVIVDLPLEHQPLATLNKPGSKVPVPNTTIPTRAPLAPEPALQAADKPRPPSAHRRDGAEPLTVDDDVEPASHSTSAVATKREKRTTEPPPLPEELRRVPTMDVLAIAPVKISRPGEPTEEGLRLDFKGRPLAARSALRREVGARSTPSAVPTGDVAPPVPPIVASSQSAPSVATPARTTGSTHTAQPISHTAAPSQPSAAATSQAVTRRFQDAVDTVLGADLQPWPTRRPARTRRWVPLWMVWTFASAALVLSGAALGLWVHRNHRGETQLNRARQLAGGQQAAMLRLALEHARQAATLRGRGPEVVALAARIHARLAYEFGESSFSGAASLAEESRRGPFDERAAADLALTDTYLHLATHPLPQSIARLRQLRVPGATREKRILLAIALYRSGDYAAARRQLDTIAQSGRDVRAALLSALVAWRRGRAEHAREQLRALQGNGLSQAQVQLVLDRFDVIDGSTAQATIKRLRKLETAVSLSTAERSWARLLLAVMERRAGRYNVTKRVLGQALDTQPNGDPDYHALAAHELLATNQHQAALREANRAIELAPLNPFCILAKARMLLAMDEAEQAAELLSRAPDVAEPERSLLAIRVDVRRGRLGRARRALAHVPASAGLARALVAARVEIAANRPHHALRALSGEAATARLDVEASTLRGIASARANELRQAERHLRAALAINPNHPEALWALGRLQQQRGQAAAARSTLFRATRANPYRLRARIDYGWLLLALGRHEQARQAFDAVLARHAHHPVALEGRARARVELRDLLVIDDLRALEQRGHKRVAELLRARLSLLAGRYEQALARLEKVGKEWLAGDAEARLWRADALRGAKETRYANTLYRELLKTRYAPAARLGLAEHALENGHTVAALALARKAVNELNERGVHSLTHQVRAGLMLARCHLMLGATSAAVTELLEVLELSRGSFDANYELGRAYLHLGKRKKALRYLAASLRIEPRHRGAKQQLKKACRGLPKGTAICP